MCPPSLAVSVVEEEKVCSNGETVQSPTSDVESPTEVKISLEKEASQDVATTALLGWRKASYPSLGDAHASVPVPITNSFWKNMVAFSGLGFLISVGYMDPGNWATDLSGGSQFGYTLLCVIMISNFIAIFLQYLSLKLGIAGERDLAQACRDAYPKKLCIFLWIAAEVAITACDLAEVIGAAIALNLLFGIPLWGGVLITAADVLLLIFLEARNFRLLEFLVFLLTLLIAGCFVYELIVAKPVWPDVFWGLVPKPSIIMNRDQLFIAIGILGATVMPHNLFLHSSIIQTRAYQRTTAGKAVAIKFGTIDSTVSLLFAFFINAAILILAGAAFHYADPPEEIDSIEQAYELLAPSMGAKAASIIFGISLLASGQNSTITGTLAGQIVMEGFLNLKMKPWMRRLVTRLVAIVPAVVVAACLGDKGVNQALVVSQVILSMTLTFAMVPLVHFTSRKIYMREFANHWITTTIASLLTLMVAGLNVTLICLVFAGLG